MEVTIDPTTIKELLKEALIEVLQERKDILHDLISEAIEAVALTHAIRKGEATKSVRKEEILGVLEN